MDNTKIEWADATWNPVTGCRHGCEYCYARRIAERFGGWSTVLGTKTTVVRNGGVLDRPMLMRSENGKIVKAPYPFGFVPTFHRYRLDQPARWEKPRTIFVCSMADLFGEWVPTRWIIDVLDACAAAPQHRYLFLTKAPWRYLDLGFKGMLPTTENYWFGTTPDNFSLSEMPQIGMRYGESSQVHKFLSIEPILHSMGRPDWDVKRLGFPEWVIIGAETGNRAGKIIPRREWIDSITEQCDALGVPVLMKDSLIPIVGAENMRRDFPWGK